jgi:hypothetical protein
MKIIWGQNVWNKVNVPIFSYFGEISKMRELGLKTLYLFFFIDWLMKNPFLGPSSLIWDFAKIKKIWNINRNHFEKRLLHTFCPQMIFIFPFPYRNYRDFGKKTSLTPLNYRRPEYFWWVIFIGVLSHITEKKSKIGGVYLHFFLVFLIWWFFLNTLYFFNLDFFIFYYFFSAIRNSKS